MACGQFTPGYLGKDEAGAGLRAVARGPAAARFVVRGAGRSAHDWTVARRGRRGGRPRGAGRRGQAAALELAAEGLGLGLLASMKLSTSGRMLLRQLLPAKMP